MTADVRSDTGPFAMAPEWVIYEASDRALKLFLVLHRHEGPGGVYPSRRRLMELVRCSESSLDRAIAELEDMGALEVVKRWRMPGGEIIESEHRPDPRAEQTSNRYLLRHVRQGALALRVPSGEGVASPVGTPGVTPDATPRHQSGHRGVTVEALIENPLNENPDNENSEIPPPPRALRLVEPVAVEPPGHSGSFAVIDDLNQAYAGLAQLVAELCGWLAPSASVSDQLLAWARDLSPEDVFRIRRECEEAVASDRSGRRGNAWALVKAVAGRVYAARKSERDPWAEPRPRAASSRRPGNAMPPSPAHTKAIEGVAVVGFTSDGRTVRRRDVARGHLEDGSPIPAELTS